MRLGKVICSVCILLSSIAEASNYQCFVGEEGQQNALGTMTVDTRNGEISFVAIDKFLFAACKGVVDEANSSSAFLLCAYVMEANPTQLKNSLADVSAQNFFRTTATETRSLSLVAEDSKVLFHTYRRNARVFQLGCELQAPGK
jgi:hypothetical protein